MSSNADQADPSDVDTDGVGDACEPRVLAHSYDDWSLEGEQGAKGWQNGYYNRTLDADGSYYVGDFEPFVNQFGPRGGPATPRGNHWTGAAWALESDAAATSGPWTFLGPAETRPNGVSSTPGEEHWTIRRWRSDRAARVALRWHLRKTDPACGDGVTGHLFLNGEMLDASTIPPGDTAGVHRTVVADVRPDDIVDLALAPSGFCGSSSDDCDASFNYLKVSDVPPVDLSSREVLADSTADWSTTGTQGERSWFYGYYDQRRDLEQGDGRYGAEDFMAFLREDTNEIDADNHWDGFKWDLVANSAGGPWVELNCLGGHPSANGLPDTSVHWAVRRWECGVAGKVRLDGVVSCPGAGDGVVGRIFHNGKQAFAGRATRDGARFSFDLTVALRDVLDFAIDADGSGRLEQEGIDQVSDGGDSTYFTVAITRARQAGTPLFRRGDVDQNGGFELTDAVQVLNYLFLGVPTMVSRCLDAADADDSGEVQLTDAIVVLGYLFLGNPPPRPPFPDCGEDPAARPDGLGCIEGHAGCW